jgi:hypothetical protein
MLGEKDVAEQCVMVEKAIAAEGIDGASDRLEQFESTMRGLLQRYAEAG